VKAALPAHSAINQISLSQTTDNQLLKILFKQLKIVTAKKILQSSCLTAIIGCKT
jgi:hypothetical protein